MGCVNRVWREGREVWLLRPSHCMLANPVKQHGGKSCVCQEHTLVRTGCCLHQHTVLTNVCG